MIDLYNTVDFASHRALVTQYAGTSLLELMRERSALSLYEQRRYGNDLCRMLRDLERAGFVHRDIKPANIAIGHRRANTGRKRLLLFDFSLHGAAIDNLQDPQQLEDAVHRLRHKWQSKRSLKPLRDDVVRSVESLGGADEAGEIARTVYSKRSSRQDHDKAIEDAIAITRADVETELSESGPRIHLLRRFVTTRRDLLDARLGNAETGFLIARLLAQLHVKGNSLHINELSDLLDLSTIRLTNRLAVITRVLNRDGYPALRFDRLERRVVLDPELLKRQFEIEG